MQSIVMFDDYLVLVYQSYEKRLTTLFLCCRYLEKEDFLRNLHILSGFVQLKSVLFNSLWVAKSDVVPQQPSWLRDKWDDEFFLSFVNLMLFTGKKQCNLVCYNLTLFTGENNAVYCVTILFCSPEKMM